VVVGDGAVGLLGVLSARRMGAERIIAMRRHEKRQKLAREYGATDIVAERGDEGLARIKDRMNATAADLIERVLAAGERAAAVGADVPVLVAPPPGPGRRLARPAHAHRGGDGADVLRRSRGPGGQARREGRCGHPGAEDVRPICD
jgi:threonine dehydrogenase-like Zn-dependent dehydrogenase